ncbi:MAG: hypothetical protein LBU34_03385 [Planctomycetaceae bacterium]|jgi:hypothetical protein|nr:hypothetical protein [Planctomycetaceae bacterium]
MSKILQTTVLLALCTIIILQTRFNTAHLTAAEEIIIPAINVAESHGNIAAADKNWDKLCVLHGKSGSITWKFNVKTDGDYYIQALYASNEIRPCTLKIYQTQNKSNEIVAANIAGEITGGFKAPNLKWKLLRKTKLTKGEWLLNISTINLMPHFRGFRITTDANFPDKDIILEQAEKLRRIADAERKEKEKQITAATRAKLKQLLPDVNEIIFVNRATFQSSHYYTDFIDGSRIFGSELCALSLKDGTVRSLAPSLKDGIIDRCNLSFDGKKVIFDYRAKNGEGYRIWEVNIDGTGLRQLTFPPDDEEARINKYWMRNHRHWGGGDYRHHTDDMHPAYLPDGGFVFISTRCEYGIPCDGPDYLTVTVLYRADKDGKNIEKLSNNALSETCPVIMEDGRILYTRWEYVDNGSVTNKGLWALNPDGTASSEVYGANIAYPSVFNVGRQIPNQPHKFVCIGAPHMPVGLGTVLLVDTTYDRQTVDGVKYITPDVDQQHQSNWQSPPNGQQFTKLYVPPAVNSKTIQNDLSRDGGGNTNQGPLFMDPFPISEHEFIVSYNPNENFNTPNAYAIYLINDKGERELLYRPEKFSAWSAIPVRATKTPSTPAVAKDTQLAAKNLAQLIVLDIYAGMENVARGSIKYIRINEHVPRPWSARRFWGGDEYDQQHSVITKKTHLALKAQHGIVKVEADGSANFVVPADKNIFLQALDANYREVQRERTFINLRPGEVRSCVGCHERASQSPVVGGTMAAALRREPETADAQPGEISGARPLSYFEDVQPVLDKHCVRCHSNEKPEGKINLSSDLTPLFNRSYETLMDWGAFPVIRENHPKAGNNHILPPYSLGSHASKLVKLLDAGHYEVKMPVEDWVRLTTWVDSNGQYYGTYFGRKNIKYKNLPDFRPKPTFKEIQTAIPPNINI